jgi:hypothetical protein
MNSKKYINNLSIQSREAFNMGFGIATKGLLGEVRGKPKNYGHQTVQNYLNGQDIPRTRRTLGNQGINVAEFVKYDTLKIDP